MGQSVLLLEIKLLLLASNGDWGLTEVRCH